MPVHRPSEGTSPSHGPVEALREFGLGCEYIRERKKRGKASRKDIAAQQAAAAAVHNGQGQDHQGKQRQNELSPGSKDLNQASPSTTHHLDDSVNAFADAALQQQHQQGMGTLDNLEDTHSHTHIGVDPALSRSQLETSSAIGLENYGEVPRAYASPGISGHVMYGSAHSNMPAYSALPYTTQAQSPGTFNGDGNFRLSSGNIHEYPMANGSSPSWGVSMPSPAAQFPINLSQPNFKHIDLRYPVLEPLLPHLSAILPVSLACDLIDLYFSSSSSAQMHPMSPYVLGFVFRKRAFLHPTNPRRCQPALLASILWVAAQTSEASFLTSLPSARSKVCQKLLELTVGLLQPLIHASSNRSSPKTSPVVGGAALGGLGVALPGSMSLDSLTGETGAFGATGSIDDVITYVHLATVISASEYKGASLRWWGAAWSLARELKLGRELPSNSSSRTHDDTDAANEELDEHDMSRNHPNFAPEEEREERRRVWWLVYIVDRHLALCYNRPLFLLDSECDDLYHPMDDSKWQSGHFRSQAVDDNVEPLMADEFGIEDTRIRGPYFECRGHSIFGYFLPLMTILGEIVDVHHSKSHPRFGVGFRPARDWDDQVAEISRHLEAYEESLKRFEQKYASKSTKDKEQQNHDNHDGNAAASDVDIQSPHSVRTNGSNRMTENEIQASIVVAYSTHVMHVLHILLEDKWDPINLLDDHDLWISSQGFVTATSHAVSAAEAINQILEFDPGLEFMPFFYGVYLLQGSFLLLLIADKLQTEASPSVIKACETIVRAHEACVVTLSTEYQRNFSKVMRSALALIRGRVPEDLGEQQQRRRELLGLYRWTGSGSHQPPSPPPTNRLNKRRRVSPQDVGDVNTMSLVDSLNTTSIGGSYRETSGGIQQQQQAPTATMTSSSPLHQQRTVSTNTYSSEMTRPHTQPSKLSVGGYPLETARLGIPPGLVAAEYRRRQIAIAHELVEDLPPKPYLKDFHKIPDNISDRQRKRIEAANNEIAADHQRVERERNNQAAKKSRQTRMEALSNTRQMLNEKSAECAWFRMKILALGGSVDEWAMVPALVRDKMIREIDQRVKLVDAQNAEVKKKEDAKKRAERVKRRAEMEEEMHGRRQGGEEEVVTGELAVQVKMEQQSGWVVGENEDAE
ncbi:Xylanolytic transcriptional activator xlnR-like protein [Cladobotryum mycophilum]|uniref:Xylanolytic transcriptional activator xlnR-like protein n=1 Tax=Cladobotryum mycophilum TaxID=491253 RepID=A0ABR0T273_9HYPO